MDAAAIQRQILNPRANNPQSLMPGARQPGLKPKEADELVAYLVTLK